MDRLRVDYSKIVRLDVERLKVRTSGPSRRRLGTVEKTVAQTAISAASNVSSVASMLNEISAIGNAARRIPTSFIGRRGPMFAAPPSTSKITIGLGGHVSVFAVVGISSGAGLYGSNTPELGIYRSMAAGIWTNAGAGVETVVAVVFGPPSAFGGVSWSVGVSADVPGVGIGLSASVVFGASGPPYQFLGYTIGLGAGVSVLPADVCFQAASTQLLPLTGP